MGITTCPGCGQSFEASDIVCPVCHRCLICGEQGTAQRGPECGHAADATHPHDVPTIDRIPELFVEQEERLAEAGKSPFKTALIGLVRGIAVVWTLFLVLWNSMPPRTYDGREAILRATAVVLTGALAIVLVSSAEDRVSLWGALAVIMVGIQVLPLFVWAFLIGA